IRKQILDPHLLDRLLNYGERVMAVKLALTESGEVLAAAEHTGIAQSAQKLAGVGNDLLGIVRNRPRTQHRPRSFVGQVEHRSKIYIEAQNAAVFADHASMLAKKRSASGGKNFCRRRRRTEHVAEAVDGAAFQVDACEKRRGYALLAFAQKSVRLIGCDDVAGEEDHARGLNFLEQGSEAWRCLGPVEADDQELADIWAVRRAFHPSPNVQRREGYVRPILRNRLYPGWPDQLDFRQS